MKNLYSSLIKFQESCGVIPLSSTVKVKTKSGGEYSFKYADLPQIHEIIKPLLHKQGLGFTQLFDGYSIVTIVFHESGEEIKSSLNIENHLTKSDPQTAGGVITYFKRYTLSAVLGIVSDEDEDGNIATGNTATKIDERPFLNPKTTQWDEAIKYLKGDGTMPNILKKYRVTKANQELLISKSL